MVTFKLSALILSIVVASTLAAPVDIAEPKFSLKSFGHGALEVLLAVLITTAKLSNRDVTSAPDLAERSFGSVMKKVGKGALDGLEIFVSAVAGNNG